MKIYFAKREAVFLFTVFILGKNSPFYKDTVKQGENWDIRRGCGFNADPLVDIICSLYRLNRVADETKVLI